MTMAVCYSLDHECHNHGFKMHLLTCLNLQSITHITVVMTIIYFHDFPAPISHGRICILIHILIGIYYGDCAAIESFQGGLISAIYTFVQKNGVILGSIFRQMICLLRTHRTL